MNNIIKIAMKNQLVKMRLVRSLEYKEICGVINSFCSLLTKYDGKIVYNMLFLIVNDRFNSLRLISSFVDCE
jgi:hypothetical protein